MKDEIEFKIDYRKIKNGTQKDQNLVFYKNKQKTQTFINQNNGKIIDQNKDHAQRLHKT